MCRCIVLAVGREGSGGRGPTGKDSDNQYDVGGCMWQGAGVGGARRSSWPPSEMTSLAPAEAPQRRSLQGLRLSCGGEEEVGATKAMMMVVGMLLSWRLRKQALDGAMRAGGGGHCHGDYGGGNVVVGRAGG